MVCPNCGADVENRRFCGKCGTQVTATTPSPAEPAAPVPPPPAATAPSPWGAPVASAPPPPAGAPAAEPDPFAPPNLYAPPGNAFPPPGYPPPPSPGTGPPPGQWPGYAYGPPRTNGFATASLILSLVGWLPCGVGSVMAIVFGFVARDQIKRSQGSQVGSGLATAGIVLGFLAVAAWLAVFVVALAQSGSTGA